MSFERVVGGRLQSPSPFSAGVEGFFQGLSFTRDMKRQNAEDARRERAERQAEQMRQIQLEESGYQEVDFTRPPDPFKRESMVNRIGNRLLGRDTFPERDVRMLKMGPSAAERLAAQNRENQIADREDTQGHTATGWARDDARAAADRTAREREAGLNRSANLQVAGIHAGASRRADERARAETDREQRDQFLNELAAATGGDARKMVGIVEARPDLMEKARRWQIPGFAYSAVADAYRQRRGVADATIDAKKRTGESYLDTKRRLEREALARGGTGTSEVAQQQAAWDRAAEALRAQGKEPESVIGPKPGASARQPLSERDRTMAGRDVAFRADLERRGYKRGVDFDLPANAEGIRTISPAEYRALREQGYGDADVWEGLVTAGMSPDDATARVNALRAGR